MNLVRYLLIILGLCLAGQGSRAATTLLPNGKQCFSGVNGAYSSGSMNFFIPNTTTPKSTWQDPNQASLNTQPIQLDANGCAIIYGIGSYRQQLFDGPVVGGVTTGNLIWDVLTTDTSASNSAFWAGFSGGTPNAITVTDPGFNNTDGSVINFLALLTNTGATTISVSSGAPIAVVRDTSTGPVALSGGEIVTNNIVSVTFDATHVLFHLAAAQSVVTQAATPPPQGYLTLQNAANGGPVQTGDEVSVTQVFYSPYIGNQIPIYNGASFVIRTFPELTLNLSAAAQLASTIYDVCVFNNAGVTTLVTGPAWANSSAGSGSRGTGAGTAQIARISGVWVNAQSITGVNGANSYSIPANQCTYVGSLSIDGTAGQVSAYKSYGQSRKWGVWNAYNRQQIYMIGGDSTATWTYTSASPIRAANANSANSITIFTGLPEESFDLQTTAFVTGSPATNQLVAGSIGIGYNSTTAFSGRVGQFDYANSSGGPITFDFGISARFLAPPNIGINVITANEVGAAGTNVAVWNGTQSFMLLSALYRG